MITRCHQSVSDKVKSGQQYSAKKSIVYPSVQGTVKNRGWASGLISLIGIAASMRIDLKNNLIPWKKLVPLHTRLCEKSMGATFPRN